MESDLEGYAEYYSAELSEKVIRGMTENALKGKANGNYPPLGIGVNTEQHYEIDTATAPFVRKFFSFMRMAGQ